MKGNRHGWYVQSISFPEHFSWSWLDHGCNCRITFNLNVPSIIFHQIFFLTLLFWKILGTRVISKKQHSWHWYWLKYIHCIVLKIKQIIITVYVLINNFKTWVRRVLCCIFFISIPLISWYGTPSHIVPLWGIETVTSVWQLNTLSTRLPLRS